MKISILGTEYEIVKTDSEHCPKLKEADGLCEWVAKKIIFTDSYRDEEDVLDNIDGYIHKVLRHEAFHAIFAEMGMRKYFEDEELVDMLAMQYPKIRKVMDACDGISIKDM